MSFDDNSPSISPEYEARKMRMIFDRIRSDADREREASPPVPLPESARPEYLLKLSRNNPILHAAVTLWRRGDLPLENALILAVSSLIDQNAALMMRLSESLDRKYGFVAAGADAPAIVPNKEFAK